MCVLTYVPHGNGSLTITHNRDESTLRPAALPPAERPIGNTQAIFPQDPLSGGTWFAVHEHWICALLNGGFEKHIRQPFYEKSRGTVIPELLEQPDFETFISHFNPAPLEPFTLIAFHRQQHTLHEAVWHNNQLYVQTLDSGKPHIWSSSTLYSNEIKASRRQLFEQFLAQQPAPDQLFELHQLIQHNDPAISFKVQLTETLCTVSTIQVTGTPDQLHLRYESYI